MEMFVHQQNLKGYRRKLAETSDDARRQMLLRLLSEEEANDKQPSKKD